MDRMGAIVLLAFAAAAAAQDQSLHRAFLDERERYRPMITVGAQWFPDMQLRGESGTFDLTNTTADADVPVPVGVDSFMTLGATFGQRRYQAQDLGGFHDDKLYTAALRLGFSTFVGEDTLLETEVRPGYWTDWDGALGADDFDIPAKVLVTERAESDLFLALGVRYNEIWPRRSVLPYLGVAWLPTDTLRVDVLAPETVEVSLWPRPDLGVLLGAEVQGAEYHVRSDTSTGRIRGDVRVQEVIAYVGAVWRGPGRTSMTARIGATVAGDYRLDDSPVPALHVDGTLQSGLFVELTFGIDL